MTRASRVLFVFLDGVGIGPDDADINPFLRARMPGLSELLGGAPPTLEDPERRSGRAVAFPLDATLGLEGIPRSGTGQTTLLTGRDAPGIHGSHFGPWVPVGLRDLLRTENLLVRARRAGRGVAFANAYPPGYPASRSTRRVAAPPLAAEAAGVLVRHHEALARGEAVASEIINDGWRKHLGHDEMPEVTPEAAGANLARIAERHRFTLYAHYATDHAGHRGGMDGAVAALERVDAFLTGILEPLDPETLLLVASDHGNVEDTSLQHTRNPVLGFLAGPGAHDRRAGLESIADVAGAVLEWIGVEGRETPGG